MITFYWKGKAYGGSFSEWPGTIQVEFKRVFPNLFQDKNICSFGNRLCPLPHLQHLCGGLPQRKIAKRRYPYWLVLSCLSDPEPITPTQQLDFFISPALLWKMLYSCRVYDKKQWYVAVFHCYAGAMWHLDNEQQILGKSTRVHAIQIRRKSTRHRPVVSLVDGCWE